jgi:hypothetical protein
MIKMNYGKIAYLLSELWENNVFAVGIMGTSSELWEPSSELWEPFFCRNYGKIWEMTHRNYGKISVGTMGRYRRNYGILPLKCPSLTSEAGARLPRRRCVFDPVKTRLR